MSVPPCFGDSDTYDEERAKCRMCFSRKLCADEVRRNNGGDPDYYRRTSLFTPRAVAAPTPAPQPAAALARPAQQVQPHVIGLTAPKTMVSYRPLPHNPVREMGVRVAMSGAAAIFESLGSFFREDGYRLFEIAPVKVRCVKCQEVNPNEAKFCQGCGEKI